MMLLDVGKTEPEIIDLIAINGYFMTPDEDEIELCLKMEAAGLLISKANLGELDFPNCWYTWVERKK